MTGAIAGGATAFGLGYAWYHFSGTKSVVSTAQETQAYLTSAQEKFKKQVQEKAPNPNEAMQWLRNVTTFYAGFIPGASGYVNSMFNDLDQIHDDLKPENIDKKKHQEIDTDLPGLGQFYCVECA